MSHSNASGSVVPVCYRHDDRETYVKCSRCSRAICPDCMISAPVGFQCPTCVAQARAEASSAGPLLATPSDGDPMQVTKVLIGANVAIFVLGYVVPTLTERFGLWPLAVASGEWYRLMTATFLHGGLLHLAFNMYALWLMGMSLEPLLGRARYLTLYFGSALAGSAFSYAGLPPNGLSVGASGAIYGLFGALFIVSRRLNRDTSTIMVLLGINLALSFFYSASIDWRGHVGGLIGGLVISAGMVYGPRERRRVTTIAAVGVVVAASLALVAWRTEQLSSSLRLLLGF